MNRGLVCNYCSVCRSAVVGAGEICQDCLGAFDEAFEGTPPSAPLDLESYSPQLFPWERITTQPRLISLNPIWLTLTLLLIAVVLLLGFLRTPLPSCWEISS